MTYEKEVADCVHAQTTSRDAPLQGTTLIMRQKHCLTCGASWMTPIGCVKATEPAQEAELDPLTPAERAYLEDYRATHPIRFNTNTAAELQARYGGRKDDDGKLPYDLLPSDAVEEIIKVLQFGAKKYEPHNWAKGMNYSRPFAALMRHMWAWWRGENGGKDNETDISHLAHAGCCLLFLLAYEQRGTGKDDRFLG